VQYISTLQILQNHVESGLLHHDKAQERVAKRLSRLQYALTEYNNSILLFEQQNLDQDDEEKHLKQQYHLFQNSARKESNQQNGGYPSNEEETSQKPSQQPSSSSPPPPSKPKLNIPRGLYIHGPVGTGKSMLMDSFYENTALPENRKKRYHFHNFLSEVHSTIHKLKQQQLEEFGRNFSIDTSVKNNPIHQVGIQLSSQLSLLCLDEFQVTDIADAVILSQLFSVLFTYGTVVVATSNRPPSGLYENGLNRSYFLPFIDLLEKHCIVYNIPSQRDYRRLVSNCSSFFINDTTQTESYVTEIAREIMDGQELSTTSTELQVGFQRYLHVDRVYDGDIKKMACFQFEELCDTDRGATDFRAIAHAFDIVVIKNIPKLDIEGHNRARRFITLIDELYEAKCALLCSAVDAKTPMGLFRGGEHDSETIAEVEKNATDETEILWVDVAQQGGTPVGALASVRELAFAFERAGSRIFEMCSKSWWDRVLQSKI
jgi:protein AFG1